MLKAGIIGCGGIANGKHLPSIRDLGEAELVAFCDLIPERAEKAAKEYGTADAQVFTDYHDLLKLELDVVYVCTPNRSHCPITVDALHAGKHVMCEKPMALELEDTPGETTYVKADNLNRIASTPYGLENAKEVLIYLPGAAAEDLPEMFRSWTHAPSEGALDFYGLYNVEEALGFSGYDP